MNLQDRLRALLKGADSQLPGSELSWSTTFERAAKGRRMHMVRIVTAAAVAVAIAVASAALVLSRDGGGREPLPPADSPSPAPTPTTSPTPVARCSATGMAVPAEQPDLPPEVAATRATIIERAIACDYEGLAALADPNEFTFSFGVERNPARFWRKLERQGEPVMADLVTVLSLRPAVLERFELYGWPRAVRARASDADWQAVVDAGLLTEQQFNDIREFNLGYIDRRSFITFDGRWTTYVAAD